MRYYELIETNPQKPTSPSAGIIKPQKPLSPKQACARAKRQQRVQQQMRDERTRSAEKLRDLQAKLAI